MPKKRKSPLKLNRQTIKELSPKAAVKLPGGGKNPESVLVPCPDVKLGKPVVPERVSGDICHAVQSFSCGRPCPSDVCK